MTINTPKRKTPDVSILPMVDLLSILLIFFIVTSEFKQEKDKSAAETLGLVIDLPVAEEVGSTTVTSDYSKLIVQPDGIIELDGVEVESAEELELVLESYKAQNPNRKVELITDQKLPLQTLLQVWDSLTKAGYPIEETPTRLATEDADNAK